MATKIDIRNTIAVVAAALLPGAVLGLPVGCAVLLPDGLLFALLDTLPLL
jgi:hypothetical protein